MEEIFVNICKINTSGLTSQEREVLKWLFCGMPDKHIANMMDISLNTIKFYKKQILLKKQVSSFYQIFAVHQVTIY
jgi:DNA-binding NarL/FixJ family response regulator